jgi:predicted Rossmann fold flavoprotein
MSKHIAVIGGGAAGFFAAIRAAEVHPDAEVILYEKSEDLLKKVKISGGGRCNLTNASASMSAWASAYPRGGKFLKKAFKHFHAKDTIEWFGERGVPTKTEADGRMFPQSNKSQSVVDCLMSEAQRVGVRIVLGSPIGRLEPLRDKRLEGRDKGIRLHFTRGENNFKDFDAVIVATGGSPRRKGLQWLEDLGHKIEDPQPSLFTFNMPKEPVTKLMGVVVEHAIASIQGEKLKSEGPLLITHWGMSGPAILKLSAFGARLLAEKNYDFVVQINWTEIAKWEEVRQQLEQLRITEGNQKMSNSKPFEIPKRFWTYLLERSEIPLDRTWSEIGKKQLNKLQAVLCNDEYSVKGKTTFKEEFVTCGGVALSEVGADMQSKHVPGLFFAGEVLDIDGITGGYNFQAAWTTGYIAGELGQKSS